MALTFPSSPTPGQTYVGPNNITYTWDNTLGVWTGSSPGAGGLTAASPAQAAAGTLNTVASTPQTAVPKDASGMAGAAIIPGGADGTRPGTPSGGMFRYNTTLSPDSMEFYDSTQSAWVALATLPQLQGVSLDAFSVFSPNDGGGVFTDIPLQPAFSVRNSITVPAGYTNFIVYSTVAFVWGFDTNGNGTPAFNAIAQAGTQLGYQAVASTAFSNGQLTQTSASVFVTATSAANVSNTFEQRVSKVWTGSPVIPKDAGLLILAWAI